MQDERLAQRLLEAATKHGIEPSLLEIEVTESAAMEDLSLTVKVLQELRERGFRVALDDFGTGYSSMAYLQQLPLDVLKLDRSFVSQIGRSRESESIVTTMVTLAKTLSLVSVAEGVETTEQRDFLQRAGCDLLQGWLFSRAVTADKVPAWLT